MPKSSLPDAASFSPLSRERIVGVAVQLADEQGLEAVSMRKLAERLGVQAMSLYHHIANKEDLIDGMVEQVVSEIEVPDCTLDWRTAMRRRAIAAHTVLKRHPWAPLALVSRVNAGPAMLRYIDATLGCLLQAGFSLELADHIWNALDTHIYGFTLQELNFPFDAADYAHAAATFLPQIPAEQYPHFHRLAQQVATHAYDGIHDFEFGLELLLNGLEQLHHAPSP